jgi:hypothetical protein
MDPQKPADDPHEIDFATLTEELTEKGFNLRIFREIDEVIDVESKRKRIF